MCGEIYFFPFVIDKDTGKGVYLKPSHLLFALQNKFLPKTNHTVNVDIEKDVIEYAVWFTSGAIWSLLIKWLEDDTKYTPDDMANIAVQIVAHLAG